MSVRNQSPKVNNYDDVERLDFFRKKKIVVCDASLKSWTGNLEVEMDLVLLRKFNVTLGKVERQRNKKTSS